MFTVNHLHPPRPLSNAGPDHDWFGLNWLTFVLVMLLALALFIYTSAKPRFMVAPDELNNDSSAVVQPTTPLTPNEARKARTQIEYYR